jgi:hypothetical protein
LSRRFAVFVRLFLLARCELLLGAKIGNLARRLGARHQIWRIDLAGAGPLKISKQRAAGIGRNRGDRIANRTKAEPVEAERRRGFSGTQPALRTHGIIKKLSRAPRGMIRLSLWQKLWRGRRKVKENHYDPFSHDRRRRTACGTSRAAVSIVGGRTTGTLNRDGRIDR